MNVGLTRARASLIVLGSGKALKASGDENWCALVNSARERDLIVKPPSASGRGDCTVADVKAFVAKITGKVRRGRPQVRSYKRFSPIARFQHLIAWVPFN